MILPHPLLNEKIDYNYIDLVCEREGYEQFIPYRFVEHLIYMFSFYKVQRNPYDCIQERNGYTEEFRKLIGMIKLQDIKTDNPVIFAIRVLKILVKKVNLRKLNQSAETGISFPTTIEVVNNYKFDLKSLSTTQLVTLNLEDKDLDTVVLDDDVKKILTFYDGLDIMSQPLDPEYKVIKKQLTTYNDFFRGRRYKLALPTFKSDLGLKKLHITKVDNSETLASRVVLAIDCSLSMKDNALSKPLIRSVLLHYIGQLEKFPGLEIELLYIIGEIAETRWIKSPEQLQEVFRNLPRFILPVKTSVNVLKDFGERYPGEDVVFISDGCLNLSTPRKLNYKLHSISLTPSDNFKQTCLLSGGQFIVLK